MLGSISFYIFLSKFPSLFVYSFLYPRNIPVSVNSASTSAVQATPAEGATGGSAAEKPLDAPLPQFKVDKTFADRRLKVSSARTYFYLNEATCERNMEIFIKCLEAVSGNGAFSYFHSTSYAWAWS